MSQVPFSVLHPLGQTLAPLVAGILAVEELPLISELSGLL